jgi:integrase/recombinase XerD
MNYVAKNSEFHLSLEELRKLIANAPSARDRLIVELFALTGIRRAELKQLAVADVEFARRRIIIRHGKGGKQRIVFIPARLVDRLRAYCGAQSGCWLFPGRNGQMSLRNINCVVARAGRRAGIVHPNPRYRNISPHLLRHSFARHWKRAGGSLETLKRLLGHASLSTTMDLYGVESQDEAEQNYRRFEVGLIDY